MADKYKTPGSTQKNAKYAAMVESVDDSTGQILDTLEELELTENTLVIFTSDNGGLDNKDNPTNNAPLRSGKGYAYEGGIRVPFLVRWPGVVAAGKVSDAPVCSIDIFPTILDVAEVEQPADRPIDGLSLLPSSGIRRRNWNRPRNAHLAFSSLPARAGAVFNHSEGRFEAHQILGGTA